MPQRWDYEPRSIVLPTLTVPANMTKKILTYFLCLNILGFGLTSISHAGLIGTQTLVETEQQDVAGVEAF